MVYDVVVVELILYSTALHWKVSSLQRIRGWQLVKGKGAR